MERGGERLGLKEPAMRLLLAALAVATAVWAWGRDASPKGLHVTEQLTAALGRFLLASVWAAAIPPVHALGARAGY